MPPIFVSPKNKEEGEGGSLDTKLSYGELNKVLSSSENLWYCSIICSHVYFFIGQGESRALLLRRRLYSVGSYYPPPLAIVVFSYVVCSSSCLGLQQASLPSTAKRESGRSSKTSSKHKSGLFSETDPYKKFSPFM